MDGFLMMGLPDVVVYLKGPILEVSSSSSSDIWWGLPCQALNQLVNWLDEGRLFAAPVMDGWMDYSALTIQLGAGTGSTGLS
jgi:hypothetical protein